LAGRTIPGCLYLVKIWSCGGSASESSQVPARTKRILSPAISVGAPEGDLASRATGNCLPHAAGAWDGDHFRLAGEELYAIGFDHRVHHTRGAGLALAPPAVTAVGEKWRAVKPIANRPAGAASFHVSVSYLFVRPPTIIEITMSGDARLHPTFLGARVALAPLMASTNTCEHVCENTPHTPCLRLCGHHVSVE